MNVIIIYALLHIKGLILISRYRKLAVIGMTGWQIFGDEEENENIPYPLFFNAQLK